MDQLAERVIKCQKCKRLRDYCEFIGERKVRAYKDWNYWKKPLPGFGDPRARLLIVGLGPAANGGTRTGRMFCGDSSAEWLVRALHETGFANQPNSTSIDDGLKLSDAYITAIVRCAPPENKPLESEIENCLPYLLEEMQILSRVSIVLVLGRIAFNGFLATMKDAAGSMMPKPKPKFIHGSVYGFGENHPKLYVSYHPSRRNTQTKFLTWPMWIGVFRKIRRQLEGR